MFCAAGGLTVQNKYYFSEVECDEFLTRTRMMYTIYEIDILNGYVTMPAKQRMDYGILYLWF